MLGKRKAQCALYARDQAETVARISALPSLEDPLPVEYDNDLDEGWAIFFDQVLR